MSTSAQLRAKARETLGNNVFSSKWLYALLVALIVSGITSIAGCVPLLPWLITGPLSVGAACYMLALSRKQEGADEDIGKVFSPFTKDLGNTLLLGLLTTLYTFLWSLLFIIPGIVKTYSYAMAPYIKADHPEYTATQAIDESRKMMNGNKSRLFCLHLSFLGWLLLTACCCGIAMLWVTPYMNAATAAFYEELKGEPAPTEDAAQNDNPIPEL